jgi:hypothetical protein
MYTRLIAPLLVFSILPLYGQEHKGMLKVTVLKGDGSFNDIRRSAAQEPVVLVTDVDDKPVAGAKVVFAAPSEFDGPGGSFADGRRTFSATTDTQGHSSATGFKPNKTEGRFNIKVMATYQNMEGSAVLSQSNTLAGGPAIGKHGGNKKLLIVLGIGGAAAAGVVAATHGGKSTPAQAVAPPVTTLTVGAIAIGGPR